jgi:antirestriction protein ArdC
MNQTKQNAQTLDVYELVTNQIIAHLEKGVIPWKKGWTDSGLPQNFITRKPYRGMNLLLLSSLGYPLNFFLTFKQAQELGAIIKKGEKSQIVIFWKWIEQENNQTHEMVRKPFLRYYNVFNIAQCDRIPSNKIPAVEKRIDSIHECEAIVENMPQRPAIRWGLGGAFYNPKEDFINMPSMIEFDSSEGYYETLFHEMIHSTGHQSRLNREELINGNYFGSSFYSIEELTAELGACYLKFHAGLKETEFDNNASYIHGWLTKLKNDRRFIVYASTKAQHAVDFILNVVPEIAVKAKEEVLNG